MKLTNKEILEIWSCLNALAQKETSMWFLIGSNINKLKKDVERISEDFRLITKKFCTLNEQGEPIIVENKYQFANKQLEEQYTQASKEFDAIESTEITFNTKEITDDLLKEKLFPALIAPLLGKILLEKQTT
jgi:hypothetical protein